MQFTKTLILTLFTLFLFTHAYLRTRSQIETTKFKTTVHKNPPVYQSFSLYNQRAGVYFTSGYALVDQSVGAALFYWHFDAVYQKNSNAMVIWLNGGPGCSSMEGALGEKMAPLAVGSDGEVYKRVNSWADQYDLLFIDNPIGVGFSTQGHAKNRQNAVQSAQDFVQALKEIQKMRPKWFEKEVYLFGESFAGHYVPAYAKAILEDPTFKINFKGIGIGDGWTEPYAQMQFYADTAFNIGIINYNQKLLIDQYTKNSQTAIQNKDYKIANLGWGNITDLIEQASGNVNIYNSRSWNSMNDVFQFTPSWAK